MVPKLLAQATRATAIAPRVPRAPVSVYTIAWGVILLCVQGKTRKKGQKVLSSKLTAFGVAAP